MSTTSVAVVYAVMIEFGFNTTEYGKALLPWLTPRFFPMYGGRPSELETKFLLLCLLGMGALATWADSGAVLPAYLIGMVLAGTVGKDHALVRRLRTLTFGLLTPFYFIRAGSFVSIPALIAAPAAFVFFLVVKVAAKIVGVYPVTKYFGSPNKEAMYTTLLMSTGLTFRTIFGPIWPVTQHHQPVAIFGAGRRRHRELRNTPDRHRQRFLPSPSLAAEGGGERSICPPVG
jgi:glutathione-regulated potassium-efflux system ancillary protein KefC